MSSGDKIFYGFLTFMGAGLCFILYLLATCPSGGCC